MAKSNAFLEEMKKVSEQLDVENNEVAVMIEEKEKEAEISKEKDKLEVYKLIEREHGITKDQIEEWKETYGGKVFVVRYDEKEAYIFRYITLPEIKVIWKQLDSITTPGVNINSLLDENIVTKCCLYPSFDVNKKAIVGAGIIGTLSKQIQYVSGYISEEQAISMIAKI